MYALDALGLWRFILGRRQALVLLHVPRNPNDNTRSHSKGRCQRHQIDDERQFTFYQRIHRQHIRKGVDKHDC